MPGLAGFTRGLAGGGAAAAVAGRMRGLLLHAPYRRDWEAHLRGADRTAVLGRNLTLELWLRQVYDGTMRAGPEA